jgi:hypothetical protein
VVEEGKEKEIVKVRQKKEACVKYFKLRLNHKKAFSEKNESGWEVREREKKEEEIRLG